MVTASATAAVVPASRFSEEYRVSLLRWLVMGAAGVALFFLALMHSGAVGAQSGYPPNTVVSTYFDPRYGVVSVVTDPYGNLIDVNAATGQRIYPVYADYNYGFVGGNYINSNFAYNGFFNGAYNNGFANGIYNWPNYLAANNCAIGNFSCATANVPWWYGSPYFSGSTGIYSGRTTVVAPGGNPIQVGPPFRVKEVAQPTAVTQPTAQPAVVAAPVQAAPAPAAPAANYVTALNAPSDPAPAPTAPTAGGSGVHALSVQPAPTAPTVSVDGDDHRG